MTIMTVSQLKKNLFGALKKISAGEKTAILDGKNKDVIAYLVPKVSPQNKKGTLGILKGKAQFHADFKITEEEFLGI